MPWKTGGAGQLGIGKYLSPGFQDWPPPGSEGSTVYWDCAITIDDTDGVYSSLRKMWVPPTWDDNGQCLPLWGMLVHTSTGRDFRKSNENG